ncbi:hypothetical protein FB451DRAFT_1172979 [Mycena latifolia]|nr:hypothetical protein FB451DRAFT_1172979 [Mycena latifolia]
MEIQNEDSLVQLQVFLVSVDRGRKASPPSTQGGGPSRTGIVNPPTTGTSGEGGEWASANCGYKRVATKIRRKKGVHPDWHGPGASEPEGQTTATPTRCPRYATPPSLYRVRLCMSHNDCYEGEGTRSDVVTTATGPQISGSGRVMGDSENLGDPPRLGSICKIPCKIQRSDVGVTSALLARLLNVDDEQALDTSRTFDHRRRGDGFRFVTTVCAVLRQPLALTCAVAALRVPRRHRASEIPPGPHALRFLISLPVHPFPPCTTFKRACTIHAHSTAEAAELMAFLYILRRSVYLCTAEARRKGGLVCHSAFSPTRHLHCAKGADGRPPLLHVPGPNAPATSHTCLEAGFTDRRHLAVRSTVASPSYMQWGAQAQLQPGSSMLHPFARGTNPPFPMGTTVSPRSPSQPSPAPDDAQERQVDALVAAQSRSSVWLHLSSLDRRLKMMVELITQNSGSSPDG